MRPESFMGKVMPARVFSFLEQMLLLIAVGAAVPIGRGLLDSKVNWRIVSGRVLINVDITISAGAVVVWVPGVSLFGVLGVAAVLSSLGQSGVEKWAKRYLESRG
mgnify:CR=1 FL=1